MSYNHYQHDIDDLVRAVEGLRDMNREDAVNQIGHIGDLLRDFGANLVRKCDEDHCPTVSHLRAAVQETKQSYSTDAVRAFIDSRDDAVTTILISEGLES